MLTGFLSPKGEYYPCMPNHHMDSAILIAGKNYLHMSGKSGFEIEKFLMEKESFVLLPLSGCEFKGVELSDEQRKFLEDNLINANNKEQEKAIKKVLLINQDKKEGLILSRY